MTDEAAATSPPVEAETTEPTEPEANTDDLVLDELLIEDVSIDGMCGVY